MKNSNKQEKSYTYMKHRNINKNISLSWEKGKNWFYHIWSLHWNIESIEFDTAISITCWC